MLWTRLLGKAKFPGFIWPSIVLVLVPLARFLGRIWPVAWARWCPTPRRQSRRRFRRWQPSGAGTSEAWTWLKLDRDLSFIHLIIEKTRVWRTRQWWRRRGSVLAYGDWGPGFDSRHRLWFGPLWFPPRLPWTLGFSPLDSLLTSIISTSNHLLLLQLLDSCRKLTNILSGSVHNPLSNGTKLPLWTWRSKCPVLKRNLPFC